MASSKRKSDGEKQRDILNKQMYTLNKQLKKGAGLLVLGAGTVIGVKEYLQSSIQQEENNAVYKTVTPKSKEEIEEILIENDGIKLEAGDILAEYSQAYKFEDLTELNDKYEDKYVEVNGEFNKSFLSNLDEKYITIKGDEEWYQSFMSIQCEFINEAEISKLRGIEKGDEIVVVGQLDGSDIVTVKMKDCYVKEVER